MMTGSYHRQQNPPIEPPQAQPRDGIQIELAEMQPKIRKGKKS